MGQPVTMYLADDGSIHPTLEAMQIRDAEMAENQEIERFIEFKPENGADAGLAIEPLVRHAVVCVDGWAGRREFPCRVVGETPMRYRIAVDAPTALPPGYTILLPGMTRLVPRTAIRLTAY
jgi:hypothetical protein